MKEITFIHAADLHLDSPYSGLKNIPESILREVKDATFIAFQQVVQEAIHRQVDFVLLAGDLYDGENRNLHTQVRFRKEMEKLAAQNISVYIIHGNHDHLSGKWIHVKQPSHVHEFGGHHEVKIFTKEDTTVHIYGYSYPQQHVKERIIDRYQKQEGADYHIGMLHGNLEGQSEHSSYAPFTLHDLLDKQFDYWALGHIHKRQELYASPPIVYPGNIQGRHKKETGVKGCYYVKLIGKQAELTFIPTSHICWDEIEISITQDDRFDDLLQACRTAFEEKRKTEMSHFIKLILKMDNGAFSQTHFGEGLLEVLQAEEEQQSVYIFPYHITILNQGENGAENQPLMEQINSYSWTEQDVNEAVQPLYKHSLGRKFLSSLSNEEKEELIKEAEQLLSLRLANGGGKG